MHPLTQHHRQMQGGSRGWDMEIINSNSIKIKILTINSSSIKYRIKTITININSIKWCRIKWFRSNSIRCKIKLYHSINSCSKFKQQLNTMQILKQWIQGTMLGWPIIIPMYLLHHRCLTILVQVALWCLLRYLQDRWFLRHLQISNSSTVESARLLVQTSSRSISMSMAISTGGKRFGLRVTTTVVVPTHRIHGHGRRHFIVKFATCLAVPSFPSNNTWMAISIERRPLLQL